MSSVSPRSSSPRHTVVLSDVHLSDVEPRDPARPLWRRFKQPDLRVDERMDRFLDHARRLADGERVELIFNGDTFDFDTVLARPEAEDWPTTWLERARGLAAEEPKSAWKMRRILGDHPGVVDAWRRWVADGHELVFVIGNHDLELHWPAVQAELVAAIDPPRAEAVRIVEWFTLSGGDTLVAHGNQLDDYCICHDPLHPYIEVRGRPRVRLPFGDVAGKLMLNGMGFFNPHVEDSFIKPPLEYLRFFYRYIARQQPLLLLTWLWSAAATLWVALDEGFRPALRDPLTLAAREADAARRARVDIATLRALREVDVHPAVFHPLKVARELWLDRAALLALVMLASLQVASMLQLLAGAGGVGLVIGLFLTVPPFLFYASRIRSRVEDARGEMRARIPVLARVAGVKRVVMGHTHKERHVTFDEVEYLNTGHWSAAYRDVACTEPVGKNAFTWITPGRDGERTAELRVFTDPGSERLPLTTEPGPAPTLGLRLPGPPRLPGALGGERRPVPSAS